ncbi:MAG TPA: hypothetical protein ENN28_00225 [Candidatus Uhrbacteria bacterium]|nr:hypothetical protein [Candidatus Uhrbacteria bacterium]
MLKNIKYSIILVALAGFPFKKILAGYGLEEAGQTAQLPFRTGDAGTNIATLLGRFAGAALALSGSIFLFLIIYGGIMILTSAGNQEKVDKGKNIIIWAIIGALILGGAYAITSLVFGIFAGK